MSDLVTRDINWARKITERLRLQATNYQEAREKVIATLDEAQNGDAAGLLGYASWTAYVADVFSDAPLRLERDARQDLVAELASRGMSTRAIAPIVGVSDVQVHRDIKRAEATATSVAVETPPQTMMRVNPDTGEVEDVPARHVTGINGKEYAVAIKPPSPAKPKPEAIASQFSNAVADLNRLLDRFHRISTDAAYTRNTETISALHHADITRAINELQTLADTL